MNIEALKSVKSCARLSRRWRARSGNESEQLAQERIAGRWLSRHAYVQAAKATGVFAIVRL